MMKLVLQCPKCFETEFETDDHFKYAKCKKCGENVFIKDGEFEFDYIDINNNEKEI